MEPEIPRIHPDEKRTEVESESLLLPKINLVKEESTSSGASKTVNNDTSKPKTSTSLINKLKSLFPKARGGNGENTRKPASEAFPGAEAGGIFFKDTRLRRKAPSLGSFTSEAGQAPLIPEHLRLGNSETSLKQKKYLKIAGYLGAVFVFIGLALGVLVYRVYLKGMVVYASAQKLQDAFKQKDLEKVKGAINETRSSLTSFKSTYRTISWMKSLPYLGDFVSDGEHAINAGTYGLEMGEIVVSTIEPYADIIGFKSSMHEKAVEITTQDRLDFVIKTIPDLIPRADELVAKVKLIKEEINLIEPDKYPENFRGMKIRSNITSLKDRVNTTSDFIINSKPLLAAASYLLGVEDERTYLVLFQNDKELRPTGGFLTAYTIANVRKGKFEPVSSDDIYNLDSSYTPHVEAPEVLRKYLKGPYLISKNYRLRDMNWSPDFYESMRLFVSEAEKAGIEDIDGVIAVDTHLLVNILDVLVEIQVPGYGGYSNNIVEVCSCPQVIYELESFADIEGPIVWSENEPGKIVFAPPNYDNRKKIIGPMMNTILSNVLGLPNEKIPALFEAVVKSVSEKHILLYMKDRDIQSAVEQAGLAGRILDYDNGDFLYINDANLGGRKSNLYVTQEVEQNVERTHDGSVIKTVTITYKNPMRHDGWLNSVLPNYVRIYVPKGSELLAFDGVEEKSGPYEEFGKTVFAGFFQLRPQGVSKITLKYKLPFKVDDEYSLLIQKQSGKDALLYTINVGKQLEEFFLKTDKKLKFII